MIGHCLAAGGQRINHPRARSQCRIRPSPRPKQAANPSTSLTGVIDDTESRHACVENCYVSTGLRVALQHEARGKCGKFVRKKRFDMESVAIRLRHRKPGPWQVIWIVSLRCAITPLRALEMF